MRFKTLNDATGWLLFALSTAVYVITLEPTASYWDCGEFIAASYKLQVPHPPGAPFFLLMGRLFSLLAGSPDMVAFWVNTMSAVSSGATILFLYWTIVLLSRKLLRVPFGAETPRQSLLLIGSGVVGALAYAFTDSFWFSAVEAEVYAMSSFFTALVVWAMLKWEAVEEEAHANRWLIFIAYMMGLSIGVHLLNLVTIPALALIYYFRQNTKHTTQGILVSMGIGLLIVGVIMVGIIPGLPSLAGWFEVLFVNSFGLPFGSGMLFMGIILLAALIYGLYYSQKEAKVLLNTVLLSLTVILIGYASYTMVVIRSNDNPPIDENNPENLISFVSYLKREQYGDRPLVYGPYFDAQVVEYKQGSPVYRKGKDKYEIASHKVEPAYSADSRKTIMPRAYSTAPQHQRLYRDYMGLGPNEQPTFIDNLSFMFSYQMGHMYWRYFGWNFIGRESDIKDAGVLTPLGAFEDVPSELEANKARNNYWMIPLIVGLLGAYFSYRANPRVFGFVLLLFFLMGLALILYLNSPPVEPRERDYIYAGSFYAFAIWIGFGVLALSRLLERSFGQTALTAPAIATVIGLLAPGILAAENWNDHDRSDRYFSVDSARNFLASCAPNAILFTGGDNDTFPLWYAQEVEGFRTDVRVIVLTYFNTDWYIDQMKMQMNESEPLPLSLTEDNYRQGGLNDVLYFMENRNLKGALPLEQYMKLVRENHPAIRINNRGDEFNTIPSKTLSLDIDREKLMAMDIIPEEHEEQLVDKMIFSLKGGYLEKRDLMILDLLVTNNWERPVYFNNTSLQSLNIDLSEYVLHEGTTYRLLPVRNPNPQLEMVSTEVMYDNLMNNFFWRELDNPDVYYTEDYRNFVLNHRSAFNTLAEALLDAGDKERAKEVILRSLEVMPDAGVPFDYVTTFTVQYLLEVGEEAKAQEIARLLAERSDEMLDYMLRTNQDFGNERQKNLITLSQLTRIFAAAGLREEALDFQQRLEKYVGDMQQGRPRM